MKELNRGWQDFLPSGDCLLWADFQNYRSSRSIWATFFEGQGFRFNFGKNRLGHILGDFFHKLIWSP
jgi:hypothetical protein